MPETAQSLGRSSHSPGRKGRTKAGPLGDRLFFSQERPSPGAFFPFPRRKERTKASPLGDRLRFSLPGQVLSLVLGPVSFRWYRASSRRNSRASTTTAAMARITSAVSWA